jgi:WD40 repeat protein
VWDLRGATRRWGVAVDGPVSTLTWVGDAVLVRQRDDRAWLAQPAVTPLGQAARVGSAPTGALVLVGDGHVQVRTPDGGRHEIQSPEPNTVAFDARGAQLAVGGRNGVVQLFEVATGLLRGNFAGPVGAILQIRFSPDGALLATVTADQTLRIWDVARQRELSHRVGLGGTPLDLRYDAGGRRVVVAAADGSVRVFAVADPAAAVVLDAGEALGASHFVDGGRRVFTNSEAGVELWDATSGARLAQLTIASADGARLSEDGRVLALPRAADPVVEIRAGIDGPVRARIATAAQPGLVALDPGAARVVTTSDAAVDVWTIGGAHLAALVGHRGAVVDAAFCPDGTRIVTAGYDDQSARVWDAATGQQLGQVDATDSMNTAVFDTTCAHILTASEDRVARLWDARTFALVGSFEHASFLRAAAISPDGALVAGATGDGTLTLWDVASRQPIGSYKQGAYLVSVDFAPDGQRVLSASGDHHAIVWDIADAVPDPEVTRAFVDCHSPYRLRSTSLEVVVPATCVR